MLKKVYALGCLILACITSFSQSPLASSDSLQQQFWADSVYKKMNLQERIGQLFLVTTYSNRDNKHQHKIEKLIKDHHIGGLMFMQGGPVRQAQLTNRCQTASEVPLLIGMDLKWGLGTQLDSTISYPIQLTLGAIQNDSLIYQMGKQVGSQMKMLGVHVNFGENKENMAGKYPVYIKGLQDAGAIAFANQGPNSPKVNALRQLIEPDIEELNAFMAGNELFLTSEDVPQTIKIIKKAVRKRQIKKQALEHKAKQILKTKYSVGLNKNQSITLDNLVLRLNQPKFETLNRSLYENAVTVVKNEDNLIPFRLLDTLQIASISMNAGHSLFNQTLNKYTYCPSFTFNPEDKYSQLAKLSLFDAVVVSLSTIDDSTGNYDVSPNVVHFINDLAKRTKVVVNILGAPYTIEQFESVNTIVCSYEDNPYTRQIVPQILFGALPASGQLPVTSGKFRVNTGEATPSLNRLGYATPESVGLSSKILKRIDHIAEEAIRGKSTPGLQVLIARKGKVVFDKAYGYYTYDSLCPTTTETIYDIASITKVAATLQAILFLQDKGLIDMDKKLSYYLPELKGSNKEHMTIRDILSHQAGLWPYLPFWKNTLEDSLYLPEYYSYHPQDQYPLQVGQGLYSSIQIEDKLWQWVVESKLRDKEDHKPYDYKYSDMGYYLLQHLAEKLLNQPMEDFLTQNLYDPLGLNNLGYLPLCKFPLDRIAPTENDLDFRQSMVQGTVHDQGAALLGGIAGHAGLFSNANDLAKLLQMHLQNGEYGGETYFEASTLDGFSMPQYASNRRGAGWDKPLPGVWYGPTSEYASPKTYGHTGFTGTAAWVDPEFDLIYIFLSNRIYPEANNTKLIKTNIRTRIQDLIYKSIWEECGKGDK